MHHILVVDDDRIFRAQLACHLERYPGIQVTQAENGKEALGIMHSAVPVDLLITDIFMPDMDGIELMTQIIFKKERPVSIAVSGRLDDNGVPYDDAMYALGCEHVFDKQNVFHELKIIINKLPKKDAPEALEQRDIYDDTKTDPMLELLV